MAKKPCLQVSDGSGNKLRRGYVCEMGCHLLEGSCRFEGFVIVGVDQHHKFVRRSSAAAHFIPSGFDQLLGLLRCQGGITWRLTHLKPLRLLESISTQTWN